MSTRVCPRPACAEINEPDALLCEACEYALVPLSHTLIERARAAKRRAQRALEQLQKTQDGLHATVEMSKFERARRADVRGKAQR